MSLIAIFINRLSDGKVYTLPPCSLFDFLINVAGEILLEIFFDFLINLKPTAVRESHPT